MPKKPDESSTEGKMIDAGRAIAERNAAALAEHRPATALSPEVIHAREMPRHVEAAMRRMHGLAILSEEAAAAMTYAVSRGGELIEGPSIRMAEIIGNNWGNANIGGYLKKVDYDNKSIIVVGVFHDLETNTKWEKEVARSIRKKDGGIYSAQMIEQAKNAALSIATRNAILAGVPRAVWEPAWKAARRLASGEESSLPQRRKETLAAFHKMGVGPDRVLLAIGVRAESEISLDNIATLRGMYSSLKNGDETAETLFPGGSAQIEHQPAAKAKPSSLKDFADADAANESDNHRKNAAKEDDAAIKEAFAAGGAAFHKGIEKAPAGIKKHPELFDAWTEGYNKAERGAALEAAENDESE